MEDQTFEWLAQYQYPSEAFIYKGKIESEGIEVFMRDQLTISANPIMSEAIGGVKLYVKTEDYGKAKQILSEVSQFSLDNEGKLLQCPRCSAKEIEMQTTVRNKKAFVPFVISLLMVVCPTMLTMSIVAIAVVLSLPQQRIRNHFFLENHRVFSSPNK